MIRTAMIGTNQSTRYKTSLECSGNGRAQADDLSILFTESTGATREVGELALITDYWNEAKLKYKHPFANLPASHKEFWSTFVFNDSYTKYNSWYIQGG